MTKTAERDPINDRLGRKRPRSLIHSIAGPASNCSRVLQLHSRNRYCICTTNMNKRAHSYTSTTLMEVHKRLLIVVDFAWILVGRRSFVTHKRGSQFLRASTKCLFPQQSATKMIFPQWGHKELTTKPFLQQQSNNKVAFPTARAQTSDNKVVFPTTKWQVKSMRYRNHCDVWFMCFYSSMAEFVLQGFLSVFVNLQQSRSAVYFFYIL